MSFPYLSDLVRTVTGVSLPLPIPMFGLMVALAMLASAETLRREWRRMYEIGEIGAVRVREKNEAGQKVDVEVPPQVLVADFTVTVFIAGILGSRVFHILEHLDQFMADPASMIFTRTGLSVFGGLIFGTLAGLIFVRAKGLPMRAMLDATAPAMMLGYAIGRIGCQVSGDGDWGIEANMALKPAWLPDWLWAQTYDHNIFGVVLPPPGVYPTSLYETVMCLAGFFVLWGLRRHPFRTGWLFALYLLMAGIERFLIEQIRVNPVFDILGFHATQAEAVAVVFMVLGVIGLALLSRRRVAAFTPRRGSATV